MKLILITIFWLIVFVLLGLFFDDTIIDTVVNGIFNLLIGFVIADTWVRVFVLFIIVLVVGLIIYALLAKKIQKSLNMPKNLDMQPQTTDEFFADKPQSLHDYHQQMLDNDFVLSETLFWVNNNLHHDVGIYRHSQQNTVMGIIYYTNNIVINQEFVCAEFCEYYDNNQSITVNNIPFPMSFDISNDIVMLQLPELTAVNELLQVFSQASSKINAKPSPIINVIDVCNRFYHKEKQAQISKGYYIQSKTGDYVATYKGVFCALYKFLPITNQLYFYQRERYIKKWIDEVDE